MPTTVLNDKKGFSLIELMIAMIIMLYTTLGVYGVLAMTMQSNAQTGYRDEAIRVAEQVVNQLRSMPFDDIVPHTGPFPGSTGWSPADIEALLGYPGGEVIRSVRLTDMGYDLGVNVVFHPFPAPATGPTLKDVQVRVSWAAGGKRSTHSVGTVLRADL